MTTNLFNTNNYTLGDTLLTVKDINLSYGNKKILSDINFKIKDINRPGITQGQIVSLIGKSGIGKSQLFRIISGFNEIRNTDKQKLSGEILVNKEQNKVQLGNIGVVSQNYKLLEHRTVKKNLLFSGASLAVIKTYAEQFDLLQHLDKFPMELSGGQRQRTAILQQVLANNKIILLDEPFSGLDDIMLRKTINLLTKVSLTDELMTLVIVSHDLENSLAISDGAFLMTKEGDDGATIKEENKFNLAAMGLAWNPDIKENNEFRNLLKEIKQRL